MTGTSKDEGAAAKVAAPSTTSAPKEAKAVAVEPAYCQQAERVVDFTAPDSGVELGRFYRIGAVVAFARSAAPKARKFQAVTAGSFTSVPKSDGEWAEGDALAFDPKTNSFFAKEGSPIAYAAEAADADARSGRVRLTGQIG